MKNIKHLVLNTILLISSIIFTGVEGCITKVNPALIRDESNTTLIGLDFNDVLDNFKGECGVSVEIFDPELNVIANYAFAYSEITDLTIDNNYRGLNLMEDSLRGLTQLQTLQINTPIQSSNYKKLFKPIFKLKKLALSIFNKTKVLEAVLPVLKELQALSIFDYRSWTIDSQTFLHASSSIKNLTLFGNKIKIIHKNSFWFMEELEVLEFQYNELEKIESGAFNNLKLESLHFTGNNGLKEIVRGTFAGLDVEYLQIFNKENIKIENGAFENSTIRYLILDPRVIESVVDDATRSAWGLSKETVILLGV